MTETRIRELRTAKGLSIQALAKSAGVSQALISQVERGITDPSLETMRRIAASLDVPLFNLFQERLNDEVAVVPRERRLRITTPHGAVTYTRISPGGSALEVLEGELGPGDSSAEEPWAHPSEECVLVLKGRLNVHVGDETFILRAGDGCTFNSRIPHRYTNDTKTTTKFIVTVTPPSY